MQNASSWDPQPNSTSSQELRDGQSQGDEQHHCDPVEELPHHSPRCYTVSQSHHWRTRGHHHRVPPGACGCRSFLIAATCASPEHCSRPVPASCTGRQAPHHSHDFKRHPALPKHERMLLPCPAAFLGLRALSVSLAHQPQGHSTQPPCPLAQYQPAPGTLRWGWGHRAHRSASHPSWDYHGNAIATAPFCLLDVNKQPHYFAESSLENHQPHRFFLVQINEERLWGFFFY